MEVVRPDWRVPTKGDLAQDIVARFTRAEFESTPGPGFAAARVVGRRRWVWCYRSRAVLEGDRVAMGCAGRGSRMLRD